MSAHLERTLLRVVVWSAVAEFLLLRGFLRLGPVLPGGDAAIPVYRAAEMGGLIALNLAVLAGAVYLLLATRRAWTGAGRGNRLVAAALAGAVAFNVGLGPLLAMVPASSITAWQATATIAAVIAVLGTSLARAVRREHVVLVLLGGAQVLALAQGLVHVVPGSAGPVAHSSAAFASETLALAAALSLPWSLRLRPSRRELATGAGLALIFAVSYAARPWTLATLAMWTVSFSIFLPGMLYALALALVVAGLLAARREPEGTHLVAGLVLVMLAGLKLDVGYFALIGLAGLLTLGSKPASALALRNASPGRSADAYASSNVVGSRSWRSSWWPRPGRP